MRLVETISARLPVTYWKPREAPPCHGNPLPCTLSLSYSEHQKESGWLHPQGVCFLMGDFPVDLQIVLLPPHLTGAVSVDLGILSVGTALIHTPQPTPGKDCWLDCGLFPPTIQSEAGSTVRQPLRHHQFSPLCVTMQDRAKWHFSSFPVKWFSADSASFNSTAIQWRKKGEKRPRIEK